MTMPAAPAASERERRAARWVLALAAVVGIAVAVPYLHLPFAGEHAHYSYGAWLMRRGGAPYRDLWDNNTPIIFALHWIAEVVFGHGMASIRWFDLAWTSATLAFLFLVVRRALGLLSAALAVLFATALYFTLAYQQTAQRDDFCMLPLLAALYAVLEAPSGKRGDTLAALAAGIGTGCIFWLKPPVALAGAVCGLAALARPGTRPVRGLAALALGFALPTALVLLSLAAHGLLGAFYGDVVVGSARYVAQRRPLPILLASLANTAVQQPLLGIGIAGLLLACRRRAGRWLAAVALACLAETVVQGKLLLYHLVPLFILLWTGAAYLAANAALSDRLPVRLAALAIALVATMNFWVAFQAAQYPLLWASVFRDEGVATVQRGEERKLAALVAGASGPEETVLVWGVGTPAMVHYLAERRSPTRFAMNYAFSRPEPDDAIVARWRDEFMAKLREAPPRVIVLCSGDAWPAIGNVDSMQSFERFTALRDFVRGRYALVGRLGGGLRYEIYRRND